MGDGYFCGSEMQIFAALACTSSLAINYLNLLYRLSYFTARIKWNLWFTLETFKIVKKLWNWKTNHQSLGGYNKALLFLLTQIYDFQDFRGDGNAPIAKSLKIKNMEHGIYEPILFKLSVEVMKNGVLFQKSFGKQNPQLFLFIVI